MALHLYPVVSKIGEGGFGETFLAIHTQMPRHPKCVLKKLKPVSGNPELQKLIEDRFIKEAKILEDLGENLRDRVPRLYAYFVENNEYYLVQEFIEGQTLDGRIKSKGTIDEKQALELLKDLLHILEIVHSQNIIHRDIKPDNIILREKDGKPILIDFGAVKEGLNIAPISASTVPTSIVIGTPGFMPVEQSYGKPVFASDLYAIGFTVIYAITGKMPSEIDINPHTGQVEWQKYARNISPQLKTAINKAIQYHSANRYQYAREFTDALTSTPSIPTPSLTNEIPTKNNRGLLQSFLTVAGACTILIVGAVIGNKLGSSSSDKSPEPIPANTSLGFESLPDKPTPQYTSANANTISLGWMRLGGVNNTVGKFEIGERLIKTTQPITIAPSIVPKVGDLVTIVNSVNYRENHPQPPLYQLPPEGGALAPGKRVIIRQLASFADPASRSPYTSVWAKVDLFNEN
jgi:serine/threonine protein kinase